MAKIMEDRRQKIINTAKSIFSEKGFSGTGLREIAMGAGVSTGNIYNYFKNKDEIFDACLDPATVMESFPDFSTLINDHFPHNLHTIIESMNRVVEDNLEEYRLIFFDIIERGGKNTNLLIESLVNLGKIVFDQGVKDKFVGKTIRHLDYEFLNRVFLITTVTYFLLSKILPAAGDPRYNEKEVAAQISDIIIKGIAL